MGGDTKRNRGRNSVSETRRKFQPIGEFVDALDKGLPANLDAERLVLALVLMNGARFGEIAQLDADDFSLERHKRIFVRMKDLNARGEGIDRITVAEELIRHGELGQDGLSYLAYLDEGMPQVPHLDSYVHIIQAKSALRRTLFIAQTLADECLSEGATPDEILAEHHAVIDQIRNACSNSRGVLRRVDDLQSIFATRVPLEYLVEPELPSKAVVCLIGDSESGKTTLACAWARDVLQRGHAVLILDRDKNPRDRICDRLERLGIEPDGELLANLGL